MSTSIATPASVRQRAKTAQPQSSVKAHLIFVVAAGNYACPVEYIEHVMRYSDVQVQLKSAVAPAWEIGRLATQKGDLPIISLNILWGLSQTQKRTGREALLVVRLPGQAFALLVDECRTVISSLPPGTATFQLPPELRGQRGSAFQNVIHWQKQLLVTVQLERLLSSDFDNLLNPIPKTLASI